MFEHVRVGARACDDSEFVLRKNNYPCNIPMTERKLRQQLICFQKLLLTEAQVDRAINLLSTLKNCVPFPGNPYYCVPSVLHVRAPAPILFNKHVICEFLKKKFRSSCEWPSLQKRRLSRQISRIISKTAALKSFLKQLF